MVQMPGGDVSYECPMTGEVVKSMRRRKYLMEKNNVVDARDFEGHWAKTESKRKADKAEAEKHYASLNPEDRKTAESSAPLG